MTLDLADRIYLCSEVASIFIHEVTDGETAKFARDLRALEKSAAEIEAGEHLKPVFRLFRRIRFVLASTPIPPRHGTVKLDDALRTIQHMLPVFRPAFPALIDQAEILASQVGALFDRNGHPLDAKFRQVMEEAPYGPEACVAVKDSKLAEATADYFRESYHYRMPRVVSPFELRDAEPCDRVFVFGSPRWLVDDGLGFIFQAPRAERIDVISFAWVGNQLRIDPVFPRRTEASPSRRIQMVRDVRPEAEPADEVEADQVLPAFNVEEFKNRVHIEGVDDGEDDPEDLVDAAVALLAGSRAVFLDQSDGARSYAIDLRESSHVLDDEETFLVRESNTDIEEGEFLLLRTQGGGDLIPVVAAKILGAKAEECDAVQQQWKGMLKWYVERSGRELTAKKLAALGAAAARPVNIGNWVRTRNIRPGADADFEAVLKLIGLESEIPRFFEIALVILNARKRAGTHIRKLLLAEVKNSNLSELREKGVMTFQLSGLGAGGSMTAFRVEKILPQIHHVPYAKVSRPLPVSDDLWL